MVVSKIIPYFALHLGNKCKSLLTYIIHFNSFGIMEINKNNYYQFSDTELLKEYKKCEDSEMKAFLLEKILNRFEYDYTQKAGESKDELFGRIMENWVNGQYNSKKGVAKRMAQSHRYLQGELFWLFYEYCKVLAENYDRNYFDPRNEAACKYARDIVEMIGF